MWARKLTGICVGDSNGLHLIVGGRTWVDFSVDDMYMVDVWVVQNDFISFLWIAKIYFRVAAENDFVFSVRIEISCVFVWERRNRLMLDWGSKLTWFQWWGRNKLGFTCGIEICLVWAAGSNLTCFLSRCQNGLRFCVRAENYLDLVFRSQLTWFLCAGRKRLVFSVGIDWLSFWAGGRNWLDFIVGDRTWLDYSLGIGIDLFFGGGSKMTWV